VDFDPDSDVSGVLASIRTNLATRRTLHQVVRGERPILNLGASTYWYFARGLQGRTQTLSTGKWLDWTRAYDGDLRIQLNNFASSSSSQPATVIVVWDSNELSRHLASFLQAIPAAFGDTAEICIVGEELDNFYTIAEEVEARLFSM